MGQKLQTLSQNKMTTKALAFWLFGELREKYERKEGSRDRQGRRGKDRRQLGREKEEEEKRHERAANSGNVFAVWDSLPFFLTPWTPHVNAWLAFRL